MRSACGRERGGSEQGTRRHICRCGGVSAGGEDMRMDAGGRRGGRGAGVEGSGVKLSEGQWPRGETEPNLQLSLFLLQIVKIEKDNRIRTTPGNCIFGSVFTSNVVLELEPKVSNYGNVALVVVS